MTYYPDLSQCSYFGSEEADKLVAVGWLDQAHPYRRGAANERFIDKLSDLLVEPWAPMYLLGYADCPFCQLPSYRIAFNGKSIDVGSLNLFVPGSGFLFVAPSMILHYVISHNYLPPREFCDAILNCPPMKSPEYFQAIVENGPQSFIDEI